MVQKVEPGQLSAIRLPQNPNLVFRCIPFAFHRLAYIRAGDNGRRLYIAETDTKATRAVPTTNEVIQVFGWSPEGRYLAFAEVSPRLEDWAREQGEFLNATWG